MHVCFVEVSDQEMLLSENCGGSTHWPLKYMEVIIPVNAFYKLISSALRVKLVLGEC